MSGVIASNTFTVVFTVYTAALPATSTTAMAVAQPANELIITHNNRLRNSEITEIPQEFFVSGLHGVVLLEEDFIAI
jgi:hypothetical protein